MHHTAAPKGRALPRSSTPRPPRSSLLGLLLPAALLGCGGDGTQGPGSLRQKALVPDISMSCGMPRPDGYEVLETHDGDIGEWSEAINALPPSGLKTDLLARLPDSMRSPYSAFPSEAEARDFARDVRTPIALSIPWPHNSPFIEGTSIRVIHGWTRNNGENHRGLDINRFDMPNDDTDPSFDVYAAAPGKVIGVYFDGPENGGGGGNTIVIEHTGDNGKRIYSYYMHLRNGRTHDVNIVASFNCATDDSLCQSYRKMAQNYPLHPSWGSDEDTIKVAMGDYVTRGQKIARSGNTMTPGNLASDGKPASNYANNHLHVYIAVPKPSDPKVLIEVDPYGAYQRINSGCYDGYQDTYYPRLFAPHMPDFLGVSLGDFFEFPEYYRGMGDQLRTLSTYAQGGETKVAGLFQYSTEAPQSVAVEYGDSTFASFVTSNKAGGYVPRETRVRINGAGQARYTALFGALRPGEQAQSYHRLPQSAFNIVYSYYVLDKGWRVEDFFSYQEGGVPYYAVLFSTYQAGTKWLKYGLSKAQAEAEVAALPGAGLRAAVVNADPTFSPPRFSIVAAAAAGCTPHVYVDGQVAAYFRTYATEQARGYQLQKLQVYNNGVNFTAVFHKTPRLFDPCP